MNWFDSLKGTGSSSSLEPSDSFEDIAHMLLTFPTEELDLGHFIEEDQLASDSEEERNVDATAVGEESEDFSELLSFEPEKFYGSFYENDLQTSSFLLPQLYNQPAENLDVGDYKDIPGMPDPALFRDAPIAKPHLTPPDISAGLGKREESKNIVALGAYVASHAIWMNYNGCLCRYLSPCWRKLDREDAALREIRTLLSPFDDIRDSLTVSDYRRILNEVFSASDVPVFTDLEPSAYTINCKDGALNLLNAQAHAPCPEDHFFYAFDLSYKQVFHPPMRGDYFEMFVSQISAGDPDVRRQLLEMLAIAMTGTQLKYFYVMLGPSNSGKSQWGRFVQELLGHENVESVQSIADFGGKYTTGSVYGKLLVSCLDLPNGVLPQIAIGVLKTFCGDDSVKGELKFKQSFTYYRKPLVMLAGNHPIKVNHAEHEDALFNRMVIVPFADPNVDESERIPNLYQHFLEEAPYIVHEACLAYQDLAARNWVPTRVPIPEEYATKEGNQSLLAVKAFVEDCISFKADSQVTTAELYEAYADYASDEGYPQLSATAFSRALSTAINLVIPKAFAVKRVNGCNTRGYGHISLCG